MIIFNEGILRILGALALALLEVFLLNKPEEGLCLFLLIYFLIFWAAFQMIDRTGETLLNKLIKDQTRVKKSLFFVGYFLLWAGVFFMCVMEILMIVGEVI